MDYLELGPTPCDESCSQIGDIDYLEKSIKETRAFKNQLKRLFPNGRFAIKTFQHDFGSYSEVVAYFDTGDRKTDDAAWEAESNLPKKWDNIALKELGSFL